MGESTQTLELEQSLEHYNDAFSAWKVKTSLRERGREIERECVRERERERERERN